MTKRWWLAFSKFDLRFGWLVLLALLAQTIVIYVDFGGADVLRRFVFPVTYVLLVAFVVLNRRRVGFLIIGAGMLLNLLVIVANWGLMPIAPATMERAGLQDELVELEPGDSVPHTKNVLLDEGDTHLELLSDRFTWGSPGPVPVFSIGDVVIGIGLIIILVGFLLPILQRASRDGLSPT